MKHFQPCCYTRWRKRIHSPPRQCWNWPRQTRMRSCMRRLTLATHVTTKHPRCLLQGSGETICFLNKYQVRSLAKFPLWIQNLFANRNICQSQFLFPMDLSTHTCKSATIFSFWHGDKVSLANETWSVFVPINKGAICEWQNAVLITPIRNDVIVFFHFLYLW